MLKAILIDDEPLARAILKEYLQFYPAIEIVQECNDGFEGLKAIHQHQPDFIFQKAFISRINLYIVIGAFDEMQPRIARLLCVGNAP